MAGRFPLPPPPPLDYPEIAPPLYDKGMVSPQSYLTCPQFVHGESLSRAGQFPLRQFPLKQYPIE